MNVLKKLNKVEVSKPYHGFTKLSKGYHEIVGFRESVGKFGRSVIAELKSEIIFLPQYIAGKLNDKDIEDLNAFDGSMFLYFGGRHEKNR